MRRYGRRFLSGLVPNRLHMPDRGLPDRLGMEHGDPHVVVARRNRPQMRAPLYSGVVIKFACFGTTKARTKQLPENPMTGVLSSAWSNAVSARLDSPRVTPTLLYDRRVRKVTRNIVERISI